jgi:hypothetical protein
VTTAERDQEIASLRTRLTAARAVLTAEPTDANLRVVERLRGDLVAALNARNGAEMRRAQGARRRERSGG